VLSLVGQRACGDVDLGDLTAGAHVDARLTELVRAARDQPVGAVDDVGEQVGDAARRVGGVGAALEHEHVQLGVAPARHRRGAHARGVATDDRQAGHRRSGVAKVPITV
jgi:hypothetical protein